MIYFVTVIALNAKRLVLITTASIRHRKKYRPHRWKKISMVYCRGSTLNTSNATTLSSWQSWAHHVAFCVNRHGICLTITALTLKNDTVEDTPGKKRHTRQIFAQIGQKTVVCVVFWRRTRKKNDTHDSFLPDLVQKLSCVSFFSYWKQHQTK